MTILCIKPAGAWWSNITQGPAPGPECGELCNAVVDDGGYVLDGYGNEPYDTIYFIPLKGTIGEEKKEEYKECLNV